MNHTVKKILLVGILCLKLSTSASQDSLSSFSLEIDFTNDFVWRDFANDNLNWGAQPNLDYTFANSRWTIGSWMNIAHDFVNQTTLLEATTSLSYGRTFFDSVEFSWGVSYYPTFLFETDSSIGNNRQLIELTFYNAYPAIPSAPELEVYFHPTSGLYSSLSLGHTFPIGRKMGFQIGLRAGLRAFGRHQDNGLTDIRSLAGIPFQIRNYDFTLSWNYVYLPIQKSFRSVFNLNISLP